MYTGAHLHNVHFIFVHFFTNSAMNPVILGGLIYLYHLDDSILCFEKYVHIPRCQVNGAFHVPIKKNRVSHILFVEKRGLIIYLAALKRNPSAHTSVLCHI